MSLQGDQQQPTHPIEGNDASHSSIPPLIPVTPDVRAIWEDYRNTIEGQAQKHFSMPGTFQMVPLRMFIVDKDGLKTYFFKARLPNNKFVNVRVRLSGLSEPRDNQVAVETHASGGLEEAITNLF